MSRDIREHLILNQLPPDYVRFSGVKSPTVSRPFLSILADVNKAILRQFRYQYFFDCTKFKNYKWYHCHFSVL